MSLSGFVNVRNSPYNAVGDGFADDSAAIQTALNEVGRADGGIVFLPTGTYNVATHLAVPAHTSLSGVFRAPQAWAQFKGTTLLATERANQNNPDPPAFITLAGDGATLEGVAIFYPNQTMTNPPMTYPWTLRAGGVDNVTLQNVLLVNPYDAVDLATFRSGRHLVRGLYGQPLHVGIHVDKCYDVGRIHDVHFWPFWTANEPDESAIAEYQATNAFSFIFNRTDWEVVQDVFSYGYHVGAAFSASPDGAMNGQMSNINFDNVDVGLDLYDTQEPAVHISNLNIANNGAGASRRAIWNHAAGSEVNLNVSNASFWGALSQIVRWEKGNLLSLSNSRVLGWDAGNPAVDILAGRAMIHDNFFKDQIGTAIRVWPGSDRVMVTNNQLAGNRLQLEGQWTLAANNHH